MNSDPLSGGWGGGEEEGKEGGEGGRRGRKGREGKGEGKSLVFYHVNFAPA
jgi:hypothetical protein